MKRASWIWTLVSTNTDDRIWGLHQIVSTLPVTEFRGCFEA